MSYCYFLSYARIDLLDDPFDCVCRFYRDLDREVRRKLVLEDQAGGFFDSKSTQHGDRWPDAIGEALQSCNALIGLYSSGYFASEFCGKEWAVFNSRAESFSRGLPQGQDRPPLFLPILFDPPQDLESLPPALASIQYLQDDYPQDYRENGLRYLMVRDSLKDTYQDFLVTLVAKLLRAIKKWKLPKLDNLPDILTVPSAFYTSLSQASVSGATAPGRESAGPRWVDIICVAGRRSELEKVKKHIDAYGEEGWIDWKPYWPDLPREMAMLAQEVAYKEGFLSDLVSPLVPDLPTQIREAREKRRIVVLLADTWTLKLPFYRELMREYDEVNFWNSCVLIAWNPKDEDTASDLATLRMAVRIAFVNRSRSRDERRFIEGIDSPESLAKHLGVVMQRIKLEVIEISEDLRKIETGEVFNKPEIPVPA